MEGGLVVFCAQNCGEDGAYYPAYYGSDDPSTIGAMAVAATDCNDVKWLWSNFGTWVDISAPGVSVLTTNNDNGYISVTGTSLAAPYVSGVAALILSHAYNQGATLINTDVWDILVNNTDNIEDVNYPCFVGKLGSGRLNAFNSLNDYDNCYYYNPVNLIISCNTIWANNVDNKRTIEIHNGANLTISGFTLMQSNTSIIVKNSSILTIDGGHLTKRCDKLWQGIIVENGGTLRIINGGQIKEFEHIIIEDGGTIEYYANSQIELSDDESHLNIVGNLVISNNAQFTFTGNGYIIFSNPGPDATYNITAGTGASMLFSGSGQSDKVLEIQQNTVHFPQLSSLTFHNCKIEMGTSKRMQADVSYPVTFNNVKVTSTTGSNNSHRSFLFIGQSNVTINNCMFEYGQYGIYGNLTWTDGAPLYINNSIFRNNTKGMHIIGKGIHLINCTVLDNSTYGIYCTGMSFPSAFESCYFISNNDGLYYNGSTSSNIDIEDTYFAFNYNDGIRASGGFNLNLECSFVIDNVRYGIYATNGTKIYPFKCDMSNNLKTIYLNYGTVNLNAKYNQLQALNDGYTIYGFAPSKAACGINVNQICNNNRWELNQSAIPVYNSNFRLWVYGCPTNPPTIINLTDSNPLFQTCGSKMSRESLLAIDTVNQSMFFTPNLDDEAIDFEIEDIHSENTDYGNQIINEIESYILQSNSLDNTTESLLSERYNYIHELIAKYYIKLDFDQHNETFNESVSRIIDFNNSLASENSTSVLDYYSFCLDIALLYQMIDNYDLAIEKLDILSEYVIQSDVLSDSEYDYLQKWICFIGAEKLAKEGLLTIDEFMLAIEDCDLCMTNRSTESDDDNGDEEYIEKFTVSETSNSTYGFYISPNPNNGSFTITLEDPCDNCELRIINSIGQIIRIIKPAEKGLTIISIDGLPTGHYNVIYFNDNKVIDSETVVVK